MKRKTANIMNILRVKRKSTIRVYFVAILSPVFAQLIQTSDSDQNSGVGLVFGQSKETERNTNPKSEVTHCTLSCGREVGDQNARSHGRGEFQRVHDLSLPIHNSKNYLQCTVHHSEPTIHTSDAFIISFHNSAVCHHHVCTHLSLIHI